MYRPIEPEHVNPEKSLESLAFTHNNFMKTLFRLLGASGQMSNRLVGTVGLLVTLLVVGAGAEPRAQATEARESGAMQNTIADSPLLLAQAITPGRDRTNTRVRVRGNRIDIDGGTRSRNGANLFHSFERFGLSRNQIANFLADPRVRNILGRVTGGEVSRINGLIRVTGSNANLFLINPAGIVFGANARLDVAGDFTAATADRVRFGDRWLNAIGTPDYADLLGNPNAFAFTSSQPGVIINDGELAVATGQNLNLLGGTVVNTGRLSAPGGQITVTAVPGTNRVEIRQEGTLLVLEVEPLESNDLANPLPFTPASLPTVLTGGSDNPATGVTINPDGTVELTASNTAIPTTPGTAIVSGTVDVSNPGLAPSQTGGTVGIFGTQVGLVGATVNASGTQGGGSVLIGGDYLGQGTVPNAQATTVSADSNLSADATASGNGGRVIVWADDTTRFRGSITAQGGATAGNGGFVETSGARSLDTSSAQVDASAPNGTPGTWLLDPSDITIQAGGTGTLAAGLFDPPTTGAASSIAPLTIETALNGGTNVIITTSSGTGGVGDITLAAPINQTGGGTASLTLTGRDFFRLMGSTINLTSTGGLTFNINQVNPSPILSGFAIRDAVDAIGTVAGSSTINLGAGTYQFRTALSIGKSLTINGAGAATTILDGQRDVNRVLNLSGAGVTLNLNRLSLEGGLSGGIFVSGATLNLNNSNVRNSGGNTSFGGGIWNDTLSTLNVTNSTISGNSGIFGAGIFNQGVLTVTDSAIDGNTGGTGGGIFNTTGGTATVTGSTVSNNVGDFGGGIFNRGAVITVTNSTISGNSSGQGGGIYNESGGTATVTDSLVTDNSALTPSSRGGGLTNFGTASVTRSTIFNNRGTDGGGIANNGTLTIQSSTIAGNQQIGLARSSGGILNEAPGVLTLTDSTVSGNIAAERGGGLFNGAQATITNSTIAANSAGSDGGGISNFGTLTLGSSIVAGNTASVGADIFGALNSQGSNLVQTRSGSSGYSTLDLPDGTNPLLAPLGNYGGTTQTHGLLPGSPAIEGSGAGATATDQRGVAAVGIRDIGAFESRGFTVTASGGTPQTTNVTRPFAVPLGVTVQPNVDGEPVAGGVVTFRTPTPSPTPSPTIGATATLSSPTAVIDASGQASVTATANATPGTFAVAAGVPGVTTTATFDLTNALFSTLTVDSLADVVDNDLTVGNVSLREAIAFLDPSGTIDFDPALRGRTITQALGEFGISRNLTLTGLGANNLFISGNNASRVFQIDAGVTATIQNLSIIDGNAAFGAGINNDGALTLSNIDISSNVATNEGGGIFSGTGSNLTLSNTTFSGNTAAGNSSSISGLLEIDSPVTVGSASLSRGPGGLLNTGNFRLSSPDNLTISINGGLNTQGANVVLQAAGAVTLNSAIATNGGAVRLIGDTDGNGQGRVQINQLINTSGDGSGGEITVQGSSVNNPGISINDFSLVSGGAPITLTGTSTSDNGVEVTGFGSIDSGGGNLSLRGTSTTGQGVSLTGADGSTGTVIASGGGNVDLTGGDRLFLGSPMSLGGLGATGTLTLTADAMDFGSGFSIDGGGKLLLQPFGDTLTLLSPLNVSASSFSSDAVVNVTLQAEQDITTRSISTSRGRGVNLRITSTNGDIDTTAGTLSTGVLFGNSAAIALSAANGSIRTGDLDTSRRDSEGGSGNGGPVSLTARDRITTGNINTSSTNGNGGDVTLDPRGDVEVGLINAEGSGGTGGNVDITTRRFFRALQSFTAQNGAIASISTAGTAGNGTITIRHGGGQRDVPFRVGNAEINGTAAALTTGAFTLANQDIPGSFEQGGIRLVTGDRSGRPDVSPDDVLTRDLIEPEPPQSDPESPDGLIPDDVTIDARNNPFEVVADLEEASAAQFESYLDIPVQEQAPILTSADVSEALDRVKAATGVTPCLIYINFAPNAEAAVAGSPSLAESDRDQLELVLVTSDQQVIRKVVPGATRGLVLAFARQFRSAIIDPSDRQSTAALMESSRQLYQWLIAPLESELQQRGIQNLSFVPDVGLRSLPMAALNDGNQFLVEKYSLGLMPAISLVDTTYVGLRDAQVLAMGASEFPQFPDLSALPGVPLELATIRQNQWLGSFLPDNTDFTVNTLQGKRQQIPYGIVHLATHANFQPGEPGNSYIQFEDQRLQLDQLRDLGWNNPPVELLILSACRTALGNEQAELGFAGSALQARVKSVLASLWSVSDLGSSGLMAEFYDQLRTAPIKAEALRAAQLGMLRGEVYIKAGRLYWTGGDAPLPPELAGLPDTSFAHPYYWSAFTLIGSPW